MPARDCPPFPFDLRALQAGDLDGDGDLDLIGVHAWWSTTGGGFVLLLNDGAGTFLDASQSLAMTQAFERLLLHDLDQDGDLDVLADGLRLINDGSGGFTSASGPASWFADLNGDGDLNVVSTGWGTLSVGGTSIPWGWQAQTIAWPIDVDDDGDIDIVAANSEFVGYQWHTAQVGVLYNQHRDLRCATLPRIGRTFELAVRAANDHHGGPSTLAVVMVATARLPQPVPLFGWGNFHLDPNESALLGPLTVPDADTAVETAVSIPATPSLAGLQLSAQALLLPVGDPDGIRLSAAITEEILP